MSQLSITDPSYDAVAECQRSVEGQNILHNFGEDHLAELPPIGWVPHVKINDVG
jgi:hypothetical protein